VSATRNVRITAWATSLKESVHYAAYRHMCNYKTQTCKQTLWSASTLVVEHFMNLFTKGWMNWGWPNSFRCP